MFSCQVVREFEWGPEGETEEGAFELEYEDPQDSVNGDEGMPPREGWAGALLPLQVCQSPKIWLLLAA